MLDVMTRGLTAQVLVGCAAVASLAAAQDAAAPKNSPRLPYAAVHNPQFMSAEEATFMNGDDRVIGLVSGSVAKAFPAGILAQHGLVQDESRSGPIAVTW
jgi:hypothetical protein